MHCGTEIRARDNIPVVSYLLLRGRCRRCRAPIGLRYPAVELAHGAARRRRRVIAFGPTLHALAAGALLRRARRDLARPTSSTGSSRTGSSCRPPPSCSRCSSPGIPTIQWPAAGLGAALFLFVAALAYPRGMGMGDVKLALLLGVGVGRAVPVALLVGMLAALVPSVVLLARHGAAARKMEIPFAPFLALGGVLALFAGQPDPPLVPPLPLA